VACEAVKKIITLKTRPLDCNVSAKSLPMMMDMASSPSLPPSELSQNSAIGGGSN
jgi:hypothetical protein